MKEKTKKIQIKLVSICQRCQFFPADSHTHTHTNTTRHSTKKRVKEISFRCCSSFFSVVDEFCVFCVSSGGAVSYDRVLPTVATYLSKCRLDASLLERLADQRQLLAVVAVASVHYSDWKQLD